MTSEQAQNIVERIMARFPRGYRDAATMGVWADEFQKWPYQEAVEAITPLVRGYAGEYPPPLNALKDAMLRAREAKHREKEKARLPPPSKERSSIARRTRKIIDYLFEHGTGPLGASGRKWQPHITPEQFHADRKAGIEKPGTKRMQEACLERYGYGWDDPNKWQEDEKGNMVPPNAAVDGEHR